jgi:hypothetical protein
MSPAIEDGVDKNCLVSNLIKHGEWKALGQEAMIPLVCLAMDAAVKPQRLDVRKKIC